ncbi:iron chelate uptake ABC transporter family permease subunit, partial [Escherichia coli]|uniref:iron chelate uptake ABC transporter family permease subunit n=1 Tax=Escherichia coli TaxID=562 RepID=UPI001C5A127A
QEIFQILMKNSGDETAYNIIWEIRLPRILSAVILGGALSVSGFLLQTFFGNPIAGPFVLGISSGAKLVVSLVMIYLLG